MSEDSENKSGLSIDNLAEGLRLARELRGKIDQRKQPIAWIAFQQITEL